MTKLLRESEYCTGTAELTDDGLVFGCQKKIQEASEEERNKLTCIFLDMSLDERCYKCPLKCPNNKNENFEAKQREIKELNKILDSMNNFGVTGDYAYGVVDRFKKNGGIDPNMLDAIGFSNSLLNKSMSGASYDISHFQYLMRSFIKYAKKGPKK